MDLKEFVESSLLQIVEGVAAARSVVDAGGSGAVINPVTPMGAASTRLRHNKIGSLILDVEFDVAVTATEGSERKGGIGIVVASIGIGGHRQTETSNQSVSRLRFSVPVILPNAGSID